MKIITLLLMIAFPAITIANVSNAELQRRIDLLAEEMAQLKAHQTQVSVNQSVYGLGQSASKVYHIPYGLSIGGYGEITYLHSSKENEAGDPVNADPTAEVLRNILYFGYKFNDKWLVNMELEIEHVSQVFTEFLYVDYLASEKLNYRAGLLLHPLGFINELHEPVLYPSVLRPHLETYIIPTTWRTLGAGIFGSVKSTDYKLYLLNSMNADGFKASSNRGARKRGGHYPDGSEPSDSEIKRDNQNASRVAVALDLDHHLSEQLMVGLGIFSGQATGQYMNLNQTMAEIHSELNIHEHKLRFLWVRNDFTNAEDWNEHPNTSEDLPLSQQGFYLEYAYRTLYSEEQMLVPFIRYERYNLQANRPDSMENNPSLDRSVVTAGLNYLPFDRLVFKADYSIVRNAAETGVNEFALGLGYNF